MLKRGKPLKRTGIKPGAKGLTRRTPLPRSTKPMARTKLAPVSKKKRRLDREQKPMLDEYRRRFPVCQRCGRRQATDVHEMLPGSLRMRARALRSCILHLCRYCHEEVQHWPKEKQLACKLVRDHAGYDLAEFCNVLGRQIEQIEVEQFMPEVR